MERDSKAWTDRDLMYFGKYSGKKLGDVPDSYWIWFLKQNWCDQHPRLVQYANNIVEEDNE